MTGTVSRTAFGSIPAAHDRTGTYSHRIPSGRTRRRHYAMRSRQLRLDFEPGDEPGMAAVVTPPGRQVVHQAQSTARFIHVTARAATAARTRRRRRRLSPARTRQLARPGPPRGQRAAGPDPGLSAPAAAARTPSRRLPEPTARSATDSAGWPATTYPDRSSRRARPSRHSAPRIAAIPAPGEARAHRLPGPAGDVPLRPGAGCARPLSHRHAAG